MIVLSLFDGMSCGHIALDNAGIKVDKYYASEIDKYAQIVSAANYPDIIRLGDITKWQDWNIEQPDIIIAGSPCQGFSFAGKQLNFNDPRSALFFTFVEILKYYKPKYFLLENVIMKKEYNDVISGILGELYPDCISQGELFRAGRLEPIEINSALVSAQNRRRLYWTNIQGFEQPKDKGILLKDIIENDVDKKYYFSEQGYKTLQSIIDRSIKNNFGFRSGISEPPYNEKANCLDANYHKGCDGKRTMIQFPVALTETRTEEAKKIRKEYQKNGRDFSPRRGKELQLRNDNKSNCLTTGLTKEHIIIDKDFKIRMLTPIECERLQTVPDNYTAHVSNSQRYKMLGNGWTVDVIAHILGYIK